jgi:hypothetical protein
MVTCEVKYSCKLQKLYVWNFFSNISFGIYKGDGLVMSSDKTIEINDIQEDKKQRHTMTNVYIKQDEIQHESPDQQSDKVKKHKEIKITMDQQSQNNESNLTDNKGNENKKDDNEDDEETIFELIDDAGEEVIMKCGEDLGEFEQIVEVIDDTKFVEYTEEMLRMQIIDLLNYENTQSQTKRAFANLQKHKKFLVLMTTLNSRLSLLESLQGFIIPRICNKPIRIMSEDEDELNELVENDGSLFNSSISYVRLWSILKKRTATLKNKSSDKDTTEELMIQERLWERSNVVDESQHRIQIVIKKETFALDYTNKLIVLFPGEVVEVCGFAHIKKQSSLLNPTKNYHFQTSEYVNYLKTLAQGDNVIVHSKLSTISTSTSIIETDHNTFLRLKDGATISIADIAKNDVFLESASSPFPIIKHPHRYIIETHNDQIHHFIFDLLPEDTTGYETIHCFVPSVDEIVICTLQDASLWQSFSAFSLRSIERYIENVYNKKNDTITNQSWTNVKDVVDKNVKLVCESIERKIMRTKKYKSTHSAHSSVMNFENYDFLSEYKDGVFKYQNTLIDTEYFRTKFISRKDMGLQYFGVVLSREVEQLYQWVDKHRDSIENEKNTISRLLKAEFNYNVECLEKTMNIVKIYKTIQDMEKTNGRKLPNVEINDYAKVVLEDGREMLYKREAINDDQHVWTFQAVEDVMMLTNDACKCVVEDVETVCSYRDVLRNKNTKDLKKAEFTLLKNMLSFHNSFTKMQKALIRDRTVWKEYFDWNEPYFNEEMTYKNNKDYSTFVGKDEEQPLRTFDEGEQGEFVSYSVLPSFVSDETQLRPFDPLGTYEEQDIQYVMAVINVFGLGFDEKEVAYILLQLDLVKRRMDLNRLYNAMYRKAKVAEPKINKIDKVDETTEKKKKKDAIDKIEQEKELKRAQIRYDVDKAWNKQVISEIIVYMISIFQARYPMVKINGLVQAHKSHFDVTGPPLQLTDHQNKHESRSLLSYMCHVISDMKNNNVVLFSGFEGTPRAVYQSLLQEIKKTLVKIPQLEIALRKRRNIVERLLYGYNEWKGYRPFVNEKQGTHARQNTIASKVLDFMNKSVSLVTLDDVTNQDWGKITKEKNIWKHSTPTCICNDKNAGEQKEIFALTIPLHNIKKFKAIDKQPQQSDCVFYHEDMNNNAYWNTLIDSTKTNMIELLEKYRIDDDIKNNCIAHLFEIPTDKRISHKYGYAYWIAYDLRTLKGRLLNRWKSDDVWLLQNKQFVKRKHEIEKIDGILQKTVEEFESLYVVIQNTGEMFRNWMNTDLDIKELRTQGLGENSMDKIALFQIAIYNEALLKWFKLIDVAVLNTNIPYKEVYEKILQSLLKRISIHAKDGFILSRLNEELREKQKETIMTKMGRLSPEERWAINEARGLGLSDWSILDSINDVVGPEIETINVMGVDEGLDENRESKKEQREIENEGEDSITILNEDNIGLKIDDPDDDIVSDTENDYDRFGSDE